MPQFLKHKDVDAITDYLLMENVCSSQTEEKDPAREINTISTSRFPFTVALQDFSVLASKAQKLYQIGL